MDLSRQTYSVEEAAQIVGVSKDAIYDALRAKRIPGIKLRKNWRVLRQPLDRMVRGESETANP
jgi:excisionase family DNA binding protein